MTDNDYKHVVQDTTNLYIGARLSYGEMMAINEVPHKFKSILDHTILKEVHQDTTIYNHIFFIKEQDISYKVYSQMRAKFRLNMATSKNGKTVFESKEYRIEDIVNNERLHEIMDEIFVEEVHISKLYLLGNYGEKKEKVKKKPVNIEDYIDEFLGEEKNEV